MTRPTLTACGPARTRRAATLLLFLGVVLPIVCVVAAFAVDIVRIMAANHEVSNAARAAARAAAATYLDCSAAQPESCATLDANDARSQARRSFEDSADHFRNSIGVDNVTIDIGTAPGTDRPSSQVTVEVDYVVNDLVFAPALLHITGDRTGDLDVFRGTTAKTAFVCIPGLQAGDNAADSCSLPR